MQIYLARNNQQAGPYTLAQINEMLASQQVLLTDLAWHQGMSEWKALGELTQGQMWYQPQGALAVESVPIAQPLAHATPEKSLKLSVTEAPLASLGSRAAAKMLDLLLWLPIAAIPSFFMDAAQVSALQAQVNTANTPEQMATFQSQFMASIPTEAWQFMLAYLLIMLIVQAVLLAKSGQSIGKKLTKIKIVDAEDGSAVNLMRAFTLRSGVFILFNLLFMPFSTLIDYAFGFGAKRQTLHDKLVKTKVVKQ